MKHDDISDAKNSTAEATSEGRPSLGHGVLARLYGRTSESTPVMILPGAFYIRAKSEREMREAPGKRSFAQDQVGRTIFKTQF